MEVDYKDTPDYDPTSNLIAKGWYNFIIENVETKQGQYSGNPYIKVTFKIDNSERKIFQVFSFANHPLCKHNLKMLLTSTDVCDCAAGTKWRFNELDMMGIVITGLVAHKKEQYNGDTITKEYLKEIKSLAKEEPKKEVKKTNSKPIQKDPDPDNWIEDNEDIPF